MLAPRIEHSTTLMPDGTVLATGGRASLVTPLALTELYVPGAGSWSPTGLVRDARWAHVALPLADGRPLIIGGYDNDGWSLNTAEYYDAESKRWTFSGEMQRARWGHAGHSPRRWSHSGMRRRGQPGRDTFRSGDIFTSRKRHGKSSRICRRQG